MGAATSSDGNRMDIHDWILTPLEPSSQSYLEWKG